jgi:hypothetical protein
MNRLTPSFAFSVCLVAACVATAQSSDLWNWVDLNQAAQGAPKGVPDAASDLSGYAFEADHTQHIFYRSGNNRLNELYWDNQGWHWVDLSYVAQGAPKGVPDAAGNPFGYVFNSQVTQHVVYRGTNNRLNELHKDNQGWHWVDLSYVAQGAPNGVPDAASDLSGYAFEADGTQHIFYRSGNNRLNELYWDRQVWHWVDLSYVAQGAPKGVPDAAGNPFGYVFNSQGTQHVVYRGTNNRLNELYKDNQVWHWVDLSYVAQGAPKGVPDAASDLSGYAFEADGTQHIFYRSGNNRLNELYWDRQVWHWVDLSYVTPGAPNAAGDLFGYVFNVQKTQHAVYRGTNNRLNELWCCEMPDPGRSVLTQHNNNWRTGAYTSESILTPAAVNLHGMRLKYPPLEVDGGMDTQPLYMRRVPFSDRVANAFFVATNNNSVYAFDADSGAEKWPHYHFADSNQDPHDLPATPVIDSKTNTLYIVLSTANFRIDTNNLTTDQLITKVRSLLPIFKVAYWLVAIDLSTGTELRRKLLQGSVARPDGSTLSLDFTVHLGHPALLLDRGSIYIAFGSNPGWEWFTEYHGWVLRYDANTFQHKGTFCTTPSVIDTIIGGGGGGGGVWQGGGGLAADADGNVYFLVGNASVDAASQSVGDSFVKLTPTGNALTLAGFYSVPEQQIMDQRDLDLGSGGLFVIPGTKISVGGGKTGMVYAVDGSSMNVQGSGGQLDSYQAFTNTYHPGQWPPGWDYGCEKNLAHGGCDSWSSGPHLHGSPTYWNGNVYAWSEKDHLKRFAFGVDSTGKWAFTKTPVVAPVRASASLMPGGLSSLSANGDDSRTGIIWSMLPSGDPLNPKARRSLLFAFDAETLRVVWQSWFPEAVREMSHRGGPTIADGKVAIPTNSGALLVYELAAGEIGPPPVPALQPFEPPPPPTMAMRVMHFNALIRPFSQIAPPSDQAVLFRLWARVDGEREQFDGGNKVGAKWQSSDGSVITTEPVKSTVGPNDNAPPWQLLKVITHEGKGRFDTVEWIQRIDTTTKGATYIFYGKKR